MGGLKKESLIRHLILILVFSVCSIITIKNNLHIEDVGELNNMQFLVAYLFKFSPVILLSSLEGMIPGISCCYILLIAKTIINRELAYTAGVYFLGTQFSNYFSMAGYFRRKRTTFLVMLFYMFLFGSVWGGMLGIIAGRGFSEFMPMRSVYYFLNECT